MKGGIIGTSAALMKRKHRKSAAKSVAWRAISAKKMKKKSVAAAKKQRGNGMAAA
jgi:hypothetical protein